MNNSSTRSHSRKLIFTISILTALLLLTSLVYSSDNVSTWSVPLNITGDGSSFTRTFGGDPGATDGYDSGLDVVAAPPGMTHYAYFGIPALPNYLETDIRAWVSPYDTDISWKLNVVNASGKTTTITWDPSNLPPEGKFTLEGPNWTLDMRTESSVSFSGNKVIVVKYLWTPAPPSGWTVPLLIMGNESGLTRTFGGESSATDGFDSGLDVVAAPPGMTYYAFFGITELPNYLEKDIRAWVAPYETDITWTLNLVNASGITTKIVWDPTNLPPDG